jgi:hypothetical protein
MRKIMVSALGNNFGDYSTRVKPDQHFAQILIRIDSYEMFEKARKIINDWGIRIRNSRRVSPNLFLIKLGTRDMRDVVLKLIENGFSNVKGYNAVIS